ncbi:MULTISPECIES: selenocysteine-specific translation elongation factor [Streptomyces]|uniref:selenocysteine-specific translation elongation factor n=1 Tax=Streptomyces TaxID=1883 RepID=UPI0020963001|nr:MULTISPECIES: selenocysteine-specific translation elongation factor [Streptomyces]MCO6696786.1 SelB C-terminal domain-containing protein [Streptomyces sp. Vc17.3-30]
MTAPGPDSGAFVVATAGHVDHGKSTLLRALTGTDPDRLAEERRRGLTLDLGFVWTTTPGGRRLAFVDVPGHHRYLATTFAGLATAPAVLLVVSADEGWRAQTGEHLAAVEAFGIRSGLLVITRADLADPAAALALAREHTAGTALADAPAVAVSARTGAGLDVLLHRLDALAAAHPAPDPEAPVRLWLDRAFTVAGAGTVVTGTLTAGTLAVDDTLELAPAGTPVAVRGLQSLGHDVERVSGPARVAVNLRRIAADEVRRGHALVTSGRWWRTTAVDVRLDPPAPVADPLSAGAPPAGPAARLPAEPLVHCGTAATGARLRPLGADSARLTLRAPLDLHVGDRLLVRDPGSRLLVGATVLDVAPPALRRRGAAAARARQLVAVTDPADPATRLRATGCELRADLAAMGFATADPEARPEARSENLAAGPFVVDAAHAAWLRAALTAEVDRYAAAHPADPGLPHPRARQRLGLPEALPLAALTGDGLVTRQGRIYRAPDAEALPAPVSAALDRLLKALHAAPFRAPTRRELDALGLTAESLALLVRRRHLERVGPHHLAVGALARAEARLGTLPQPFTVGECARALDTSRRVAVPLLEALDAAGVTRRHSDGRRTLRPAGSRPLA